MKSIIETKRELCIGCNRCVRECPMEMANITYQDDSGNIKVKSDNTKCIACGRCVSACKHKARYYIDDTERFFEDLANGTEISLIAAPSVRTNIPGWKRLFTYLKKLGVRKIYDVSLGADICIWAHIRYIEKNGKQNFITQPCPAIVTYCEIYRPELLLEHVSPVQSPMGCISVYMKEYENIKDNIAAISPCIAKSNEFESTGLADYNITFSRLTEYIIKNNIELPEEETGFDHYNSGIGSLFPMPGGLKENIEFYTGKTLDISKSEGVEVYERLDEYATTPKELLPDIFDVLNCHDGCNIGPACSYGGNIFKIDKTMNEARKTATDNRDKEYFENLYKTYDDKFDLPRFLRDYKPAVFEFPAITEDDINRAFELLGKTDADSQTVDCGACGSDTCRSMARKIALGVNIPMNCMVKAMNAAKAEHEINLNTVEQLEMIWGHVESGIVIINMKTRKIMDANPAAVRMYGAGREDIIGKVCYDFFGQHECPIMDLHQNLDRAERSFYNKDGAIIPVLKSVSQIYYKGEHALLETFTDISSIKDAEDKNRKLEIAEQANKAKSSFLANMSHEIRTPMNAILGITEIQLQNDGLESNTREAFGKIYNSGDLLLGIINDILDLSKIEAGKLELVIDDYDTPSLINDTVQLNIMRIGSKQIEFMLEVAENTLSNLNGDELRIKQIMNNLLSNAFKYTDSGKVTLSVSSENGYDGDLSDPEIATLILKVRDTGQGMTEEQVAKLFDEYSRFNEQANKTTEGTGLGMSITRNLIKMMNGKISVESEPGKGSEFTVKIPQKKIGTDVLGRDLVENLKQFRKNSRAQMKRVQISREPMPYGSVLIVDDVETNIYVAKGLLAPYELKTDSADSGFAAIEKIKKGNVYDIVFMDHMMPKMDGIEATKIIREMGYSQPIVALTANAVIGQSDMFLENGFDDFISKPIDVRQMNVVLNKLIRDKQPPEVIEETRRQAQEKKEQQEQKAAQKQQSERSAKTEKDKADKTGKPEKTEKFNIDPQFAEIFLRDANKSVEVLEEILEKGIVFNSYSDEDIRTYIINVHGMKSALANIGKNDLSAIALKLEQAGRDGDTDTVSADTPGFLSLLKYFIGKITPEKKDSGVNVADEDRTYLHEKLLEIKAACEDYDENAAESALTALKKKTWSPSTNKLMSEIAEHMLHSDFDEIVDSVGRFMEGE